MKSRGNWGSNTNVTLNARWLYENLKWKTEKGLLQGECGDQKKAINNGHFDR